MKFSAKMIAGFLKGEIQGNPDVEVNKVSKIEEGTEGSLSFLSNLKYLPYLYQTGSSIVLVNNDLVIDKPINTTLIRVQDAYQSFASLLELYNSHKPSRKGIEGNAYVDSTAKIGNNCYIGAFSYISPGVVIGDNCHIYPQSYIGDNTKIGNSTTLYQGVKIYHECEIGSNCILHAGTVIGSDGFGFAPQEDGSYKKIPQIGNVIIEDDVELGANCTIDRATMGSTIIRRGAKLDNLVHLAHNTEVGAQSVLAAQVGFAGSSKLGRNCQLGGQVGIGGHLMVGDNVKIAGQAGVISNIKSDTTIIGSPAYDYSEYMRSYVMFKKLPEFYKQLHELKKQIEKLK